MDRVKDPWGVQHTAERVSELSDEELEESLEDLRGQFLQAMEVGRRNVGAALMANYNAVQIEQVKRMLERLEGVLKEGADGSAGFKEAE